MRIISLTLLVLIAILMGMLISGEAKEIYEIKQTTVEQFPYCKSIDLQIYNATVDVRYTPELEANGRAWDGQYLIEIRNPRIETLSHEATHVADYIVKNNGLEGYEARAYLVGYITGELYRCFHK